MESRSLLVSDVDGTLLGDDAALQRFADWYGQNCDLVRLAYASGRFCDSIVQSVNSTALPAPDVVIGGVGTEIRGFNNGQTFDEWPRSFRDWNANIVRSLLECFSFLELQPREFQSPYKVSYYADDLAKPEIVQLKQRLESHRVRAEIIYSSARDLDVLPAIANKGTAARFVAKHFDLPDAKLIVSGDSGNDAAMFSPQVRGIIVANARKELQALNGPNIYRSRQSFAAGVLEGLQFWLAHNGG